MGLRWTRLLLWTGGRIAQTVVVLTSASHLAAQPGGELHPLIVPNAVHPLRGVHPRARHEVPHRARRADEHDGMGVDGNGACEDGMTTQV